MAHPDANKPVPEHRRRQGFVRDKNTGKLVRTDAAREEARRKGGVESVRYRDLERKGKEGGRYKSAINISHDYLVNMATHHLNQFETLKGFWDDIRALRDDAMGQRWRYGGEMKNPDKWTDRYIERWLNHNVLEIWRRTHGLNKQMKIEEFKQKFDFFAESRYKSNPRGWRANYNVKTSKGKKRRHETTSVAHELSPTRRVVTSKVKSRTVRKWLPDTNRSTRYKTNVQTTKKGGFSKTDDHALRGLIGAEIAKKENPEDWKHTKKLNIWPSGKPKGKGKKVKTAEYGIRKQRKHAEGMKVKQIKRKKDTPKFISDIWGDKTTAVGKKKYKTELRGTTQRTVEVKGRGKPGGHARRVDYTTKSRRVRKMLPDWPKKTTRKSQWEISHGTAGKKPDFKRNIPTKQLVKPHDDWIKSKTKKRKHAEDLYAFVKLNIAMERI